MVSSYRSIPILPNGRVNIRSRAVILSIATPVIWIWRSALYLTYKGIKRIERNWPYRRMEDGRYTWPVNEYWYPELKNKNHYYGEFEGEQCIFDDDTWRDITTGHQGWLPHTMLLKI